MSSVSYAPKLAEMDTKVIKPLGTGAGSTILQVRDVKLGKDYALKVVKRQSADDDIYVAQAQHEFDVLQRLNHRTIIKAYDFRVKRKWFHIAGVELLLELVDGRTLDDVETRDIGQLVLIFGQVASGLGHMHRRGIYHGDLKPMNLMLSKDGAVKIIDFGTAWIKGQPKDRVQGTPQYMAPEQATEKVVDDRTDLYNFGATMYRLLTGEYANLGITPSERVAMDSLSISDGKARRKVPTGPRPPIELRPEVPGTLNETVMACLHQDRDRRPAGVFEVKHQLKAVAKYLGLGKEDLKGSEAEDD